MSIRTERVAAIIKEEVGLLLQREFPMEEIGLLTLTEVRVTPDLKHAKLFVSIMGDEARKKKTMNLLEGQKKDVRSHLAHHLHLKFVPSVEFALDESVDTAMRLETLFQKINSERKQDGLIQ
ncbi:MAG: 30S ribosome-binding factor RbfA [Ignavibacteriales bacterium]|nr:30S ribosome-binding factor RbfA [Ignavibacteriales bacterium]